MSDSPEDLRGAEDHWRLIDVEQKLDAANAMLAQVSGRMKTILDELDELNELLKALNEE